VFCTHLLTSISCYVKGAPEVAQFAYSTIVHHVHAPAALNYMIFKFTETQHGVLSYSVLEEVGVEVFVEPLGENDATLPPGHLEKGGK